jgi:lysozyme family protein
MTIEDIIAEALASGQSKDFTNWLRFCLQWECAYEEDGVTIRCENVPGDSGGLTFAGVDQASHPCFPYDNPHTFDVVCAYLQDGWKPMHASEIGFPAGAVAANFAINMGVGAAVQLLQEALDAQTQVNIDGKLGPATLGAVKRVNLNRLAHDIDSAADARYRRIACTHPVKRKFLAGWLARDAALERWWERIESSETVC